MCPGTLRLKPFSEVDASFWGASGKGQPTFQSYVWMSFTSLLLRFTRKFSFWRAKGHFFPTFSHWDFSIRLLPASHGLRSSKSWRWWIFEVFRFRFLLIWSWVKSFMHWSAAGGDPPFRYRFLSSASFVSFPFLLRPQQLFFLGLLGVLRRHPWLAIPSEVLENLKKDRDLV